MVVTCWLGGDVEAKEPEWSYDLNDNILAVAISSDGEFIAAGSESTNGKVFIFNKKKQFTDYDSICKWGQKARFGFF